MSKAMGVKYPGEYYLQAIIVDEDYRGMGLGKILMKWVENEAEEKGARTLSLDVSSKNRTAIALYQRQNMSVDSIWPHLPLIPSVFTRMSKKL